MNGLLKVDATGLLHRAPRSVASPGREGAAPRPVGGDTPPVLGPIRLSPDCMLSAGGSAVDVEGRVVSGEVRYLYFVVGRRTGAGNVVRLCDVSYVDPGAFHMLPDGSLGPDWGRSSTSEPIPFRIRWEGALPAISDGVRSVPAVLEPVCYGLDEDDSVYQVQGVYSSAPGERPVDTGATLILSDGRMQKLLVERAGLLGVVRMVEETPHPGARFRVLEHLVSYRDGSRCLPQWCVSTQSLVFGSEPFTVVTEPAIPGEYVIGITAEGPRRTTATRLSSVWVVEGAGTSAADGMGAGIPVDLVSVTSKPYHLYAENI